MWRGLIIAVLAGIIGGELLLDVMFPVPAAAEQACCEHWKPCPNRKKIRMNGHTYTWYCGPDESLDSGTAGGAQGVDAGTTARRTEKRTASRRTGAQDRHAAE